MYQQKGTEVVGVIESRPPHDDSKDANFKTRSMVFTKFTEPAPVWDDSMRYLVFGTEVCPTTGTKHYQGYVYWNNPRSHRAICKKWGCWVRPARGTPKQAADYCKKDGYFTELGKIPSQGERTDLDDLAKAILDGETTPEEILEQNPMMYHQYGRTLEKLEDLRLCKNQRKEMTTCTWYVARTGKGKSHISVEEQGPDWYCFPRDGDWWENYKQQHTVVFDDFRGSDIQYSQLLRLIDWTPYARVRRRGRCTIPFTSKHIIITSSLTPTECYSGVLHRNDDIDQLLRRVKVVHVGASPTADT